MEDFQATQLKRKWQFLGNVNIYLWCWVLFLREFELELNQEQFQSLKYLPQRQNFQENSTFKIGLLGVI